VVAKAFTDAKNSQANKHKGSGLSGRSNYPVVVPFVAIL
jgi:hypothetical protein